MSSDGTKPSDWEGVTACVAGAAAVRANGNAVTSPARSRSG
ncbi:hypothetical protein [Rhizorhabdus argentea]